VNVGGFGTAEPSVSADPTSGQKPEQKHQGGDRPLAEPRGEEDEARRQKKEQGEELLAKRDPDDHSGEPMHVHDGSERQRRPTGQEGGGEHGKEKGTGDHWVKSTGLAAEGGDFDATKPGAAKEANRILETKGVHKDQGETLSEHPEIAGSADEGKKHGKLDKLKDKLHIGKH